MAFRLQIIENCAEGAKSCASEQAMNTPAPVVDTDSNTVTHAGTTFSMQPLAEDAFTVLVAGIPVGRVVFSFGAANAVVESPDVTEAVLEAVGEAWFAAIGS